MKYIMHVEQWESILFKLNDSKRYRRTVGAIASSCIMAATPLLASGRQAACLVALDIVEVTFCSICFLSLSVLWGYAYRCQVIM